MFYKYIYTNICVLLKYTYRQTNHTLYVQYTRKNNKMSTTHYYSRSPTRSLRSFLAYYCKSNLLTYLVITIIT